MDVKRGGRKKISHAFSMSSMHERQGRAQIQRSGALIPSCYQSAAAKPERWQRGQGHELGCLSHLCHLVWCITPIGFPEVRLRFVVDETGDRKTCQPLQNIQVKLDLGCKSWHQMRILTHVLLLPAKNHRRQSDIRQLWYVLLQDQLNLVLFFFFLDRDSSMACNKCNMNKHSVVGIVWSDTQERAMSEHSNPQAQPSQLHPITRKPSGPVIPVTTILGTSRMVPKDAVLRWPRLYWGRAAKTHTYSCEHNKHADAD